METQRLQLRQWCETDFENIAAYYAVENNAKYVGGLKNADEAWRLLALHIGHWQLKGFGYWAVDEKDTGDFAGCVGLWQSSGWPELELGYWLVNEHHGKGYALEAATKCKEYARDILRAGSLVSYIDPNNKASIKLAEKLGAKYEDTIELLAHGIHCVYRHF
ncbi:MAG: GNAT family N-acetyltransferase [Pseudomonadales bacterium]